MSANETPARAPLPLAGTGLTDPYVGSPGYDDYGRWTHADHYVADDDPDAPTARAARPRPAACLPPDGPEAA